MQSADLVQQLAGPRRHDAIRALLGGLTATELRHVSVTDEALKAMIDGLSDRNPRVRWWCIQLLDHIDEPRSLGAVAACLDDPVPRVRRNAAHALGCVGCKPSWDGDLPDGAARRLADMAQRDPNAKVRSEAARALSSAPRTCAR